MEAPACDDDAREYDANGHYAIGPKLKQPSFRLLIGRVHRRVKDAQLEAERAQRAESRALRQALPAPTPLDRYGRLLGAIAGQRTRNRRAVA